MSDLFKKGFCLGSNVSIWIVLPSRKILPQYTVAVITRNGLARLSPAIPSIFIIQFMQMGTRCFQQTFQLNLSSAGDYFPQSLSLSTSVLTP